MGTTSSYSDDDRAISPRRTGDTHTVLQHVPAELVDEVTRRIETAYSTAAVSGVLAVERGDVAWAVRALRARIDTLMPTVQGMVANTGSAVVINKRDVETVLSVALANADAISALTKDPRNMRALAKLLGAAIAQPSLVSKAMRVARDMRAARMHDDDPGFTIANDWAVRSLKQERLNHPWRVTQFDGLFFVLDDFAPLRAQLIAVRDYTTFISNVAAITTLRAFCAQHRAKFVKNGTTAVTFVHELHYKYIPELALFAAPGVPLQRAHTPAGTPVPTLAEHVTKWCNEYHSRSSEHKPFIDEETFRVFMIGQLFYAIDWLCTQDSALAFKNTTLFVSTMLGKTAPLAFIFMTEDAARAAVPNYGAFGLDGRFITWAVASDTVQYTAAPRKWRSIETHTQLPGPLPAYLR